MGPVGVKPPRSQFGLEKKGGILEDPALPGASGHGSLASLGLYIPLEKVQGSFEGLCEGLLKSVFMLLCRLQLQALMLEPMEARPLLFP